MVRLSFFQGTAGLEREGVVPGLTPRAGEPGPRQARGKKEGPTANGKLAVGPSLNLTLISWVR